MCGVGRVRGGRVIGVRRVRGESGRDMTGVSGRTAAEHMASGGQPPTMRIDN